MSKGRAQDILQADEKSANELLILIRVSPLHFFFFVLRIVQDDRREDAEITSSTQL